MASTQRRRKATAIEGDTKIDGNAPSSVSKHHTLHDTISRVQDGLKSTSGESYRLIAIGVLAFNAIFITAITLLVRFTEIDYQTYMQQADLFLKGQRQYDQITGDTGPCVYPAMHLYIYAALSAVSNAGKQLRPAKFVFAALYVINQAITMAIFHTASIPAYVLPLLALSKRLPSIYVLRMFNDCWAATFMNACILALCIRRPRWGLASTLFSLALGVKMNILLYAPAFAVIYLHALGLRQSVFEAIRVVLIQALLGMPFLLKDWRAYMASAFNFSRAFLYVWTVNWRFFDEETFLSKPFAQALLALHAIILLLWLMFRWTGIYEQGFVVWIKKLVSTSSSSTSPSSPRFVAASLFTCNLIGITFARSLHYQFYSWYAQQIPFLIYFARLPLPLKFVLPAVIEVSWNTFPSTRTSSALLFTAHVILLVGLWRAKQDDASVDQKQRVVIAVE